MILIKSPTELTTSATDLFLAIECLVIMICLRRIPASDRWRTSIWGLVFGILAFSSFLGAVAHGLDMRASLRETLWAPIYLSLGVVVALFVMGALFDLYGRDTVKRLIWPGVAACILFLILVWIFNGAFIIFVLYEGMAMLYALAVYAFLAASRRLRGAAIISPAILLSIVAAAAQASDASVKIIFPFDHNGIFHLIQIPAMSMLGMGVWMGMKPDTH